MIIKKFGFGNASEAFIEDRFSEKLNIIFSNDNNKGKTLVTQGIMYSIGNEPIFPAGFEFKKYYFYVQIKINGAIYNILRRNDTFSVAVNDEFYILDSVSDFKYFFDNKLYKLPEIIHKGFSKLVDLHLFYQIFFIGQDKRDTSTIFNNGFYNKSDFIQMLYALAGISGSELTSDEIKVLKDELRQLRYSAAKLSKEIDRFKINKLVLNNVKSSSSYQHYQEQKARLEKLYKKITELDKKKSRELTRLNKHLGLEAELNSLNRNIDFGKVSCNDCGSENIIYKSKDISFDISNKSVRKSILASISHSKKVKREIIARIDYDRSTIQTELNKELSLVPPELRDIILFKEELDKSGALDKELTKKQKEIEALQSKIDSSVKNQNNLSEQQKSLLDGIVIVMNEAYKNIDETGIQNFSALFTKKGENYSGSEEQEFYFSKLFALYVCFQHEFPLIVDSFRDRELSSSKELKMLDTFEQIDTQVILTSTLKDEEYKIDKYVSHKTTQALDYSSHKDSQILNKNHLDAFKVLCGMFKITNF